MLRCDSLSIGRYEDLNPKMTFYNGICAKTYIINKIILVINTIH